MPVVVVCQFLGCMLVFVGLPGMLGVVMAVGVVVIVAMLVRVAVLMQVVVAVGMGMGVGVLDLAMLVGVAVHMGVLVAVIVLVFVAVAALVAVMHLGPPHSGGARALSRLHPCNTQSHNRPTLPITTRTSSMKLSRLLPAMAVALAAVPAAAHNIGVDHSHSAMDSSLVLGVLLAVAGIGAWWAKNR